LAFEIYNFATALDEFVKFEVAQDFILHEGIVDDIVDRMPGQIQNSPERIKGDDLRLTRLITVGSARKGNTKTR
jgi:hypothetical protein